MAISFADLEVIVETSALARTHVFLGCCQSQTLLILEGIGEILEGL
jgi:hypothetical protein